VKRVLGIVFLGLGIALATFAAGLRFYVTPLATNIPYDLDESTSIAEATNGQYINTSNGTVESGTLRSSTFVVPQPVLTKAKLTGDLIGTAVIWDVYSQIVDADTDTVISASSTPARTASDRTVSTSGSGPASRSRQPTLASAICSRSAASASSPARAPCQVHTGRPVSSRSHRRAAGRQASEKVMTA